MYSRVSDALAPLPQIITDDDYKDKQLSIFESDIRIFIYNIDKFNKEGANMKKVNEVIGDSFYQYLSNLPGSGAYYGRIAPLSCRERRTGS